MLEIIIFNHLIFSINSKEKHNSPVWHSLGRLAYKLPALPRTRKKKIFIYYEYQIWLATGIIKSRTKTYFLFISCLKPEGLKISDNNKKE